MVKINFFRIIILLSVFFIFLPKTKAQIISQNARINWNPGIPANRNFQDGATLNILDFGADSSSIIDCKQAFLQAIRWLPKQGGTIYFPAGKYRFSSAIEIDRDNVKIKGAGADTKLFMDFSGNSVRIDSDKQGAWQSLNDVVSKGDYEVLVEDGSKFSVGQFAEIQQNNDPEIMYTKQEWNQNWAENAVGQLFEVADVKDNKVTFKTPTHVSFRKKLNPLIRPVDLVTNIVFEDFCIEKKIPGGHTFYFNYAAYCKIDNVESNHTRRSHVNLTAALGCEVLNSYFHHSFSYGGGGSGYGVECGRHATDNLVQNNIFNWLRHAMLVQVGANGNVFGYNYSVHAVQGDGETNLNVGWTPPDISIHGHYTFMNLFEGNDLTEIGIGDYWGPPGPGNTFLRNKIRGEGIFYYDESQWQNIIGNETTAVTDVDKKAKNNLLHGNIIAGKVVWNKQVNTHKLPDSYYLDTAPSFVKNKTHWPFFGPGISKEYQLPAQIRFEKLYRHKSE